MIKIDMKLCVKLQNHSEMLEKHVGGFKAWMLNLPIIKSYSHPQVEEKLKDRIVDALYLTLAETVEKELQKEGVKAEVNVEFGNSVYLRRAKDPEKRYEKLNAEIKMLEKM
ncbi:MAG: hypothetical protein WAX69_11555, partial [Victivallales bacterium]